MSAILFPFSWLAGIYFTFHHFAHSFVSATYFCSPISGLIIQITRFLNFREWSWKYMESLSLLCLPYERFDNQTMRWSRGHRFVDMCIFQCHFLMFFLFSIWQNQWNFRNILESFFQALYFKYRDWNNLTYRARMSSYIQFTQLYLAGSWLGYQWHQSSCHWWNA